MRKEKVGTKCVVGLGGPNDPEGAKFFRVDTGMPECGIFHASTWDVNGVVWGAPWGTKPPKCGKLATGRTGDDLVGGALAARDSTFWVHSLGCPLGYETSMVYEKL